MDPEAARVLRPGGRLLSISTTAILLMSFRPDDDSAPAEPVLHGDYFGMHRFRWHDENKEVDAIEFHLTCGEMIRLLRSCGFEVEDLVEIRAPDGREGTTESDVPWEWARRWPSVEAWKARKVR